MLWPLIPIVLGVIASPMAVMALIGVLLSKDARRNGAAYLTGWTLAIIVSILFWYFLFEVLAVGGPREPALWVRVLHFLLAIGLTTGAVVTYRRARDALARLAAATSPDEIAAATPQLPGILVSASRFTPRRALVVGGGIFLLNPLNISLVIAAALDVALSSTTPLQRVWLFTGFIVAAACPVAVPVSVVWVRGSRAAPMLEHLRTWIARNNGMVSAGLLLIVAVIQFGKALDGAFAGM